MTVNTRVSDQPVPEHNAETALKVEVLNAISLGLRADQLGFLLIDLRARTVTPQAPP